LIKSSIPRQAATCSATSTATPALVDFMVEWRENQLPTPTERLEHWVMYFDGLLKLEGAGVGVLLIFPKGEQHKCVLQVFLKVSNNKFEYEALLHGLRLAISLGIKRLLVYSDSTVVINQVNKSWDHNKETWTPTAWKFASLRTSSTVSSSIMSSVITTLQQTSCRRLVLLEHKYLSESSSMSFTRHPSQSQRPRPLVQHHHILIRGHDDRRRLARTLH
jgi:ribonuclease HI